jgi:hypothetical protein
LIPDKQKGASITRERPYMLTIMTSYTATDDGALSPYTLQFDAPLPLQPRMCVVLAQDILAVPGGDVKVGYFNPWRASNQWSHYRDLPF